LRRHGGAPLAAILLLSLAGCGEAPGAATVVELWAMGREGEVVEQLMPEFERRHPGVRVRVQQIPWSAAHEKLLTAFVGGAMPDVFQAGSTWIPELVALDALEPLDARLASSSIPAADLFAGIRAANEIDGRVWGVPWYVDTRVLFLRTDRVPEPPRTWEAWMATMQGVKEQAGEGGYAILLPIREWELPVILALQLDVELLRDGERYGNFRSAEFRRAFDVYLEMFSRGFAPRAGDTQVANVYQDFAAGFFALYVTGPWNLGEFARRLPSDLQPRWGTAPLPGPGPGYPGVSLAGGASLALHRASPRKDAAWALIAYLSEPATQVAFYRLTGDLPARRSAWSDPALAGNPRLAAFRVQLEAVRATPKVPEWERIAAKVVQWTEAAVRADASAEDALTGLDGDVDAILEKRRWLLERGSE
jgi:multiple sugar transport system substrate-binding protein